MFREERISEGRVLFADDIPHSREFAGGRGSTEKELNSEFSVLVCGNRRQVKWVFTHISSPQLENPAFLFLNSQK